MAPLEIRIELKSFVCHFLLNELDEVNEGVVDGIGAVRCESWNVLKGRVFDILRHENSPLY